MTLSQWLTDWLSLRTPSLKPRTVESYADLIRRYIAPSIGETPLDELTPAQIAHLLAPISAAGHTRTAELIYVMLRSALRDLNPALMQRVPRPAHVQQSPAAWTDDQIVTYLRALEGHRQQLPLTLGLMLGLRRGEICGLRWEAIDFAHNLIHVVNQRQRLATGEIVDCSPKSRSSIRTLPIPSALLPLLRARRQLSGYLCTITPSGLDAAHRRLVGRLELPYSPLHGLRHTMATSCIRHGGEMRSLQNVLGHASYTTTADRYTHPDASMLLRALEISASPCYNVIQ